MRRDAKDWSRRLWVALCVAAPAAAQVNVVRNGSFEEPANGFGTVNFYSSIPGWTLTVGPAIEVQNNVARSASPAINSSSWTVSATAALSR